MEKVPNIELREQELKFDVEKAKEAALFADEYKEKESQYNTLRAMRKTGALPKNAQDQYIRLKLELLGNRVDVNSLYEYRKVLELADFSPEQIDHILNHENAHANVAEQVESQTFKGYRILFTRDKDGELLIQPFAKLSTNYSFSDKQISEDRIKVIEAPLHYGEKLSPDDKEKIQELQKSLLKAASKENESVNTQEGFNLQKKIESQSDSQSETLSRAIKKGSDIGFFTELMNLWSSLFKKK